MKPNPLVLALGLLVVLGGAVYYTRENPPEPEDTRPKLVDTEDDNVQEVVIRTPEGETLTLRRGEDDKWEFGPPLTIRADDPQIGFLITNLASMNADRVVGDEVEDWAPYGLEGEGGLSVEAKFKEGDPIKIIFGAETPTGSGIFARIDSDPRLFTVYSYIKSSFEKKPFDLRDKKLLKVDSDKVSRVTVTAGGKTIEFGKSGSDDWQILKPRPLRADNYTVGDLARSAYNAQMSAVIEEGGEAPGKPSGKYSFDKPFALVEVVDEAGAHLLTIAKGDDDIYYAKSSDAEGIYEISSLTAKGFDKELKEFRNKKLFDFGFTTLKTIKVRDGETRATIEKRDDDWLLTSESDRKLDSEKVQTLIDSLRNLTAIEFPSDNAADQAKYGLSEPEIETEVLAAAEDAKAEKVALSALDKDRVYAARVGEASAYEVEKAPAEEIRRAIEDLLKVEDEEQKSDDEEN